MEPIELQVYLTTMAKEMRLEHPFYATAGAAAFDLHACIQRAVTLNPNEQLIVPNGIHMAIPDGFVGLVAPRSGMAAKHGITVLNAPGVIDSDYRGEVSTILINHSGASHLVRPGDRISQMLIVQVNRLPIVTCHDLSDLSETERGHGRFGSTGQ